MTATASAPVFDLASFLPAELRKLADPQKDLPRIARDRALVAAIEANVRSIPTHHKLILQDARLMSGIAPESVHLVLTSPPYWTLKEYREAEGQMGAIEDYEGFLTELQKVWRHCYDALVQRTAKHAA